jgi:hypothetical protein
MVSGFASRAQAIEREVAEQKLGKFCGASEMT